LITPNQFDDYQKAIRNFLLSEQFWQYTSENFAGIVVEKIKQDFSIR